MANMTKGRCIGILIIAALMYAVLMVMLLFINGAIMVMTLMATILAIVYLWRFRPQTFAFMSCLRKREKVIPDMDQFVNKEVFLSDLVLCSVGAVKTHTIALNRKQLLIGVAEGCDIVLPRDAGVSRVHAKIFFNEEDRQFYIQDQGSSNGTYLNGVRLRKDSPKILCKGDELRFATATYAVKSAYYQ